MEFAWALGGGLSDEAELASVATQLLIAVLHMDEAGFSMIDPARDGVTHIAVFPHPQDADHIRSLLATVIDEYPITMHLAREPALVPLRMSDLVPPDRFRWTRTYATMFEPRNLRHQLVLPLMADPSRRSRTAYSLTRADTDFTDDELLRAHRVQPLLAAAHAAIRAPRGHHERGRPAQAPPDSPRARRPDPHGLRYDRRRDRARAGDQHSYCPQALG